MAQVISALGSQSVAQAIRRFVLILFVAGCAATPAPQQPTESAPPPANSPTTSPTLPTSPFESIDGATLLVRGERAAAAAASEAQVAALARANGDFGLDLYRAIAASGSDNIVLGPHSISSAMAMIYAGARGDTATEMASVLHFADVDSEVPSTLDALNRALASRAEPGVVDIRNANQAFARPGLPLVESYLETLTRDFGAPLAELSFADGDAARKVINKWAAQRTNDRIKELFPQGTLSGQTVLVVVNAVSLDAKWHYLFDPTETGVESFTLADGTTADVPTMHFNLYLPLAVGSDYQAVELPYGAKGDVSMVLFLPDDFAAFEANVNYERLAAIFDAISEQGIHLSLPKFEFKSHPEMDAVLQGLGMRRVYGDADFTGMVEGGGVFLHTVQHEAFIKIDESGTEAHAATGASVAESHGPTITFDRPFFFVIRDRVTGAILFLGRVMDPRAA